MFSPLHMHHLLIVSMILNGVMLSAATPLFIVERDLKVGFVDTNGSVVIGIQFDAAHEFSDGLAAVMIRGEKDESGDRWGFVDTAGRIAIPVSFSAVTSFDDGLAAVRLTNEWRLIRKNGETVRVHKTDSLRPWSVRGVTIAKDSKVQLLLDGKPHEMGPMVSIGRLENGIAPIDRGDFSAYINGDGTLLTAFKYDLCLPFSDGMGKVALKGKHGYIDVTGNEVIPPTYDFCGQFSEGLAPVRKAGKWGFINKRGETVIKFIYGSALPFSDGLAAVEKEGMWGYIGQRGQAVLPFKYLKAKSFVDGIAGVQLESGAGLIDKSGNNICDPVYLVSNALRHGVGYVANLTARGFTDEALIRADGKVIWSNK